MLCGEYPANPPEMAVIAAAGEELGERRLRQRRAGERGGELVLEDRLRVARRGEPADAVPGRNRLRERAAVDAVARWIEGRKRLRPLGAEIDIAIDIVFDERNAVLGQKAHHLPLFVVRHGAAERIVVAGREQARRYRFLPERPFQRREIDTRRRVRRQLDRLQGELFEDVKQAEIDRRLDRNGITGSGNRPERQRQRLGATASDDDVLGRKALAPSQRAAGDLLPQLQVTLGVGIDVVLRALESRCPGEEAIQTPPCQQFGARDGAAERDQPRVGGVLE